MQLISVARRARARTEVVLVLVGLSLAAAGCGSAAIDTSSIEALRRSIEVLREPLEPQQLQRFDEALGYLVGGADLEDAAADPQRESLVLAIYEPLAGYTADGVLAEAHLRRLTEVRAAIDPLEQERIASRQARAELAGFSLSDRRVFKRNKGFLEWPVLEMKVHNGTERTVHLIRIRAALLAPGNLEPWLLEELDHLVIHGLEPGGDDLWRLEPEQQGWIQLIDPHPEVSFTLDVVQLSGLGRDIHATTRWSSVEAHRLAIYQDTLKTIRSTHTLALSLPPLPAG